MRTSRSHSRTRQSHSRVECWSEDEFTHRTYRSEMFNPNNASNAKKEKAAKKKALADLKATAESLIPQDIHDGDLSLICPNVKY